jgi:hypothetical protein
MGNTMKSYRQIAFDGLSRDLTWIKYYAHNIGDRIRLVAMRPDYPTIVNEAMDRAEQELVDALQAVRDAKQKYQSLPVEDAA